MKNSRFLDSVREVIRSNHFSYGTEKAYVSWIYRYIIFHNKKHPEKMGGKEIAEFLTYLAAGRKVSASTQNQALNALIFLYKKVLQVPLVAFDFNRAKIGRRIPVVLSRDEVKTVLSNLHGEYHLMTSLLYGSGLRLSECLKLRVKDLDFDLNEINVRAGKGDNDRRALLPQLLIPQLRRQIEKTSIKLEENLLVKDFAGASILEALERKYPNAPKELAWQYIFLPGNLQLILIREN